MTSYLEIDDIIRFFLTHTEHYQWEGEPLTTQNAKGRYVCKIIPTNPDGFQRGSAEHLEKTIKIWRDSPLTIAIFENKK